jgi:hypothetical protein
MTRFVCLDLRELKLEQIGTPMDIADRVDANAIGQPGFGQGFRFTGRFPHGRILSAW